MRGVKSLATQALTLILISSSMAPAIACGPFFDDADFSYDNNPDLPLKNFVGGRLGVLQPSFAKSYLVTAYRYMSGKPLSSAQQRAVMALLCNRLDTSGGRDNLNTTPGPVADGLDSAVVAWKKARLKVPGTKAIEDINTLRQITETPDGFGESYLNCNDDAFRNASTILQAKTAKHGLTSPFVKNWLAAQDKVFCHCGGNQFDYKTKKYAAEPGFPELTAQDSEPEAKFDRQYQIAAAHFYAQQFDAAFKAFSTIADDTSSPYSALARYMSARCYIRKANLVKQNSAVETKTLDAALKILTDMCANNSPQYQAFHTSAQKLISLINCTLNPDKQINVLGRILATTGEDNNFQQELDDYTTLVNAAEGFSAEDYYDPQSTKTTTPKTASEDDLTHWISCYQLGSSGEPNAFKTAEAQYEKTHSVPWLLAALTYAPFDKAKTGSLISAAKAVPHDSPAYVSVNYALAKLLIGIHDTAGAASVISTLEALLRNEQLPSSLNFVLDLRAKLPMNVGDFAANSVRTPASYSINLDYFDSEIMAAAAKTKRKAEPPAFAMANAAYMNTSMPVAVLADFCSDARIPAALKANLAQAVFVRSVLLDDGDSLKKSASVLNQLSAQISSLKTVKQFLPAVLSSTGADQKFAAANLMLHNPGSDPFVTPGAQRTDGLNVLNEFNDNWWLSPPNYNDTPVKNAFAKLPNFPGVLTAAQKAQAVAENKKIAQLGAGSTYLGSVVCQYASSHRADSRVPEALALEVRATHYGIKDNSTTKWSKQAFDLLHKNYPKSPFTARTPYHY